MRCACRWQGLRPSGFHPYAVATQTPSLSGSLRPITNAPLRNSITSFGRSAAARFEGSPAAAQIRRPGDDSFAPLSKR
jgi:hypothetical protein